ncbi:hypothetical protein B0H17DRAFT_1302321 [Mycena rosella]|uniref:Uncharacterized protein n=1 Tax=Mycena rosella TaxID=1033263 RepID=A0AAD7B8K1_MYCRO|nr:hypothetical protein B0H17DRAFT_1302321 [Mycena rosella]
MAVALKKGNGNVTADPPLLQGAVRGEERQITNFVTFLRLISEHVGTIDVAWEWLRDSELWDSSEIFTRDENGPRRLAGKEIGPSESIFKLLHCDEYWERIRRIASDSWVGDGGNFMRRSTGRLRKPILKATQRTRAWGSVHISKEDFRHDIGWKCENRVDDGREISQSLLPLFVQERHLGLKRGYPLFHCPSFERRFNALSRKRRGWLSFADMARDMVIGKKQVEIARRRRRRRIANSVGSLSHLRSTSIWGELRDGGAHHETEAALSTEIRDDDRTRLT